MIDEKRSCLNGPDSWKRSQNCLLRFSSGSEKKGIVTPPISACSEQPSCKRQQRREVAWLASEAGWVEEGFDSMWGDSCHIGIVWLVKVIQ